MFATQQNTRVNQQLANAFERMQSAVQDREKGQRVADNMIIFEQKTNPLSLEYSTMIDFDGHTFHSAEHILLFLKAKAFNDDGAAKRIATSSIKDAQAVPIAKYNSNQWKRYEHKAVDVVCQIKAKQCQAMRESLKQSGTKRLVYASKHDMYFGCGLAINDDNVLFPQFWKGQNALGRILETIRKSV